MDTAFTSVTWDEAVRGFILHVKAVRAKKTYLYYDSRLRVLRKWAHSNQIQLDAFGKRHLDLFLAEMSDAGRSQTTLHHYSLGAKVFYKWCKRNDLVTRDPLADYEVRNAPKSHKYMPTDEDMGKLAQGLLAFYDVGSNSGARYAPANKRSFHRERNFGILLTLLDSACRIGEVFNLKVDDYQPGNRQLTVRESKGREPRCIPVSADCAEAIGSWLKVRARVMANVPKAEDEGWLFISETGSRIDEGRFLKTIKTVTEFAGVSANITLHSLRRYSLNRLSKHNLLMAQAIAGHKDPRTTLIYTRIDPDFVRAMHEQVGVVRGVLGSKRAEKRKRLV